ncbi:MAG: acyltransferase [Clostridiales bacterium]|nr:acyltransferase [Clostridiales bacterium]
MDTKSKLNKIKELVNKGLDYKNTEKALRIIGLKLNKREIEEYKLWSDFLPLADDYPYSNEQRNLHILWELIDRSPLAADCAFTIPFRSIIAKKLFKKCGIGFIANEGVRFNYGHLIEVGDYVTWNHCCYIDSKGGVSFGDFSMVAEYSRIFTHSHSESDHMERLYAKVEIKKYAKVYTAATILPGVTVGKGAIVATGAIVTKDVPDFTLVAGIPAKPIRERSCDKEDMIKLNHYTLKDKAFQNE